MIFKKDSTCSVLLVKIKWLSQHDQTLKKAKLLTSTNNNQNKELTIQKVICFIKAYVRMNKKYKSKIK